MREACLSLWPNDACEWSVIDIWRWADLLQRVIYISLAVMLVYSFFVLIRFVRYYIFVRHEFRGSRFDSDVDLDKNLRRVVADLSRGLGILRAISFGAPFLALAGTSYGILVVLSRGVSGSRASALSYVWEQLPTPLISTSAGILVALPAMLFHNVLRGAVEHFPMQHSPRKFFTGNDLGSFQLAQRLPLRNRLSGFPPFAVLGVFTLTCAFVVFIGFKPYPPTTGLRISGALEHCKPGIVDRIVVLRLAADGQWFLNYEQEDRESIQSRLVDIYRMRRDRVVYLQAADELPVQTVADAIDLFKNISGDRGPIGLTVRLVTPQTEVQDAECHGPILAQSHKLAGKDRARKKEDLRR